MCDNLIKCFNQGMRHNGLNSLKAYRLKYLGYVTHCVHSAWCHVSVRCGGYQVKLSPNTLLCTPPPPVTSAHPTLNHRTLHHQFILPPPSSHHTLAWETAPDLDRNFTALLFKSLKILCSAIWAYSFCMSSNCTAKVFRNRQRWVLEQKYWYSLSKNRYRCNPSTFCSKGGTGSWPVTFSWGKTRFRMSTALAGPLKSNPQGLRGSEEAIFWGFWHSSLWPVGHSDWSRESSSLPH